MNSNSVLEAMCTKWAQMTGRKPGRLAQNTVLATFWQGIRLILQFAYLVLIARILGVEGYGLFSGIVAIAASLSPLVGLGFGTILVKEVSRAPDKFPVCWAKALTAVVLSAPAMLVLMFLLSYALLPSEDLWPIVLLVAMSELVAMPFIVAGSLAYQAHEQLGRTMFNHIQMNLVRLLAIAILAVAGRNNLLEFAWVYFCATSLAALLSLAQVRRSFGSPAWQYRAITGQAKEGLGFSLSVLASTAHSEIDKTLLLRLGGAAETGHYSIASRLVSAATTPVVAYILAAMPRLFREGGSSLAQAAHLALRLLPPILLYGVAVALAILACAPLLPLIFGPGFVAALPLLYWFAPLPFLIGMSQLGLNALSATGHQRIRVWFEGSALICNIVLNLWLIPSRGAEGAAIAMLTSQAILVVLPSIALVRLSGSER